MEEAKTKTTPVTKEEEGIVDGIEVVCSVGSCETKLRFGYNSYDGEYYVNYDDGEIEEDLTRIDLLSIRTAITKILEVGYIGSVGRKT